MKNLLPTLIIALTFVLLAITLISSQSINMNSCTKNSDCVKVKENCCDCNNGGKYISINKKYKTTYELNFSNSCQGIMCPQYISDDPSCNSLNDPVCKNNVCAISQNYTQHENDDSIMCPADYDPVCCNINGNISTIPNKCTCEQIRKGYIEAYGECGIASNDSSNSSSYNPDNETQQPGEGKIKILPETASERAKERLGDLGFTVTLKEVGVPINSDKPAPTKYIYEAKATKEGKILGLIPVKADVSAEVDSETGKVTKVHKPWWSFLAGI